MDNFLAELESEGDFDSDGAFTIDSGRAQLKLAEFQLARFGLFSDLLVQAAVAAGCRSLGVTVKANSNLHSGTLTTVYFRGWTLQEEELTSLRPDAGIRTLSAALDNLVVALSTLSSRYPVALRSRGDSASIIVANIWRGELNVARETANQYPRNTTTLRVPMDLRREFSDSLGKIGPWSSIPLTINKMAYHRSQSLPQSLNRGASFYFRQPCPELFLTPEERTGPDAYCDAASDKPPFMLALGTPETAKATGLVFWLHGSAHPILPELEALGICGFVAVPHLKRDLSYTSLLQNEDYHHALRETRLKIVRLLEKRCLSSTPTPYDLYRRIRLSIPELEETLDKEDQPSIRGLKEALNRCAVDLEPPADDEAWKQLKTRLRSATELSRTRLMEKFDDLVVGFRSSGHLTQAFGCHAQKWECSQLAGPEDPRDPLIRVCLSELTNAEPVDARYLSPAHREYFQLLRDWPATGRPRFSDQLAALAHPSWQWPFALHQLCTQEQEPAGEEVWKGDAPAWVSSLRLFLAGRALEGLESLRSTPSLYFAEESAAWYGYLYHHQRGRVPFPQAVQFRVRLSYQLYRESSQESDHTQRLLLALMADGSRLAQDLAKTTDDCVVKKYFTRKFWPVIFAISASLRLAPAWRSQTLWRKLALQSLLGAALEKTESDPLSCPFLHEVPGATNVP